MIPPVGVDARPIVLCSKFNGRFEPREQQPRHTTRKSASRYFSNNGAKSVDPDPTIDSRRQGNMKGWPCKRAIISFLTSSAW